VVPSTIKTEDIPGCVVEEKACGLHDRAIELFPSVVADIDVVHLQANLRTQPTTPEIALDGENACDLFFAIVIKAFPRPAAGVRVQGVAVIVEVIELPCRARKGERVQG